jgi:hypothetical protein
MLSDITEKTADKLICESCGEEFSCGAGTGKCWCFEIDLSAETLIDLRKDFQNCLCKDCLSAAKLNVQK